MVGDIGSEAAVELKVMYPLTEEPIEITFKETDDPIYDYDKWFVSFGNTGVFLEVHPENPDGDNFARIHFLPDNTDKPNPGNEPKIIAAGALGLSALIKWYKNYPFGSDGASLPKFKEVVGSTNKVMNTVGMDLGEDIYTVDMGDENQFFFHMNLERLCEKVDAVVRIERIASRSKRQNYYMTESPSRISDS